MPFMFKKKQGPSTEPWKPRHVRDK